LVPRSLVFEVEERTFYDGTIARPVEPQEVASIAGRLATLGIETVAICFLHAYANDANERAARDALLAALPGAAVSISSEVLPEDLQAA
jgi:N-methylhydantoinase A